MSKSATEVVLDIWCFRSPQVAEESSVMAAAPEGPRTRRRMIDVCTDCLDSGMKFLFVCSLSRLMEDCPTKIEGDQVTKTIECLSRRS